MRRFLTNKGWVEGTLAAQVSRPGAKVGWTQVQDPSDRITAVSVVTNCASLSRTEGFPRMWDLKPTANEGDHTVCRAKQDTFESEMGGC